MKTRVTSFKQGEYTLHCPCGFNNTIYTSKDNAQEWARAHDRSHQEKDKT